MIITDISAKNVLKYEQLDINHLPDKGVIAIGGPNESGKSTIGEIICFALFGRTFSLGFDELEKLIRWGESRCSVTLRFFVEGGDRYEIARFLDRDGNHGVRLNPAGAEEQPLARGVEAVEDRLYELLGFGYDEFIESFYLAQREITTPHPHSYAVKAMAGLVSLEQVAESYEEEIESDHTDIDAVQVELESTGDEIRELEIQPERLPVLEAERTRLSEAEASLQVDIDELDSASTAYQDAMPKVRAARRSRGRARFYRALCFLIALVCGGAWYLLNQMPEHDLAISLSQLLTDYVPFWQGQQDWLIYGAGGFGVLFLLFWAGAASANGKIKGLQDASVVLAEKLADRRRAAPEPVADADEASPEDPPPAADVSDEAEEMTIEEMDVVDDRPTESELTALSHRVAESLADPVQVRDLVGRELGAMRDQRRNLAETLVRQDQLVSIEKERLRKAETLGEVAQGLEDRVAEHRERIHTRELAIELIQSASIQLSRRFNRDLRDLVGRTLPLFTENRYEHLQIDDDLNVRVFSSQKRDFMILEEISSGTQRQIMLAIRLALSQELVNSGSLGKQFVFLDEPFAFFDQARTASALNVLPKLSDEITQVWIVAQEFPEGSNFDFSILCGRDDVCMTARRD